MVKHILILVALTVAVCAAAVAQGQRYVNYVQLKNDVLYMVATLKSLPADTTIISTEYNRSVVAHAKAAIESSDPDGYVKALYNQCYKASI